MAFVVAIDGPAGVGKSTVARRLANRLGLTYLDTGAMYRAIALAAERRGVAMDDSAALAEIAGTIKVEFSLVDADGRQAVMLDGEDVTLAIRTPEVSRNSSTISAHSDVRRVAVEQQRRIGSADPTGIVLEGRDIGTVVFPCAAVKVFLTASPRVRALRRLEDLAGQGVTADFDTILADQIERDVRDSERADSPLAAAPDAVVLDTDYLDVSQVIDNLVALCGAKLPKDGLR